MGADYSYQPSVSPDRYGRKYEILRPYMEHAIRHAKRLNEANGDRPASQAAPGTKVYELVEKLKPYLDSMN